MKRSVALALTIVIFAAIAFCFLRPMYPDYYYKVDGGSITVIARPADGDVEIVDIKDIEAAGPVPIELEGESDLIRLEVKRFDIINGYGTLFLKASTAVEGREFIISASIWTGGKCNRLPYGCMQRIDGNREGEPVPLPFGPGFLIIYPDGIYCTPITADNPIEFDINLPLDDVGRYRVTLYLYEWDSATKTIMSETPHEVSFTLEYKAPKRSDLSVYTAFVDNDSQIMDRDGIVDLRKISLLLRHKNHIEPYGMHLCKVTAERNNGDGWISCDDIVFNSSNGTGYSNSSAYSVSLKKELEPGDYRLTLMFTDAYYSTDVIHTVTLHLRIDE